MEKSPINPPAPCRAWQDAWKWLLNTKLGFVVVALVFGVVSGIFIGDSSWQRVLAGFAGAIIGVVAIIAITYIVFWFITPYRQRNEAWASLRAKPKPVFLANRDRLLITIAEARLATVDEADNIENVKLRIIGNTIFQDAEMWDKLARIKQRFDWACESLEREAFAAGSVFEPIIQPLIVYMRSAAESNSSTINPYKSKLEEMVTITRNKIEELSQQVSDMGDSQSQ